MYALGSVITILIFLYINPLLRRIGNNKLFIWTSIVEIITLVVLALNHSALIIAIVFILHHALYPILVLCLDIYLEHWSKREMIGSVRGLYLMTFNACAPIAALASGPLVVGNNFALPFLLSAAFMLGLIILSVLFLKGFKDSEYKNIERKAIFKELISSKKLVAVFTGTFLLQLSYTWLIVYIPLYLIQNLGMSLQDVTVAIAISLVSFIIFQIPLGKFGDKFKAEKHVVRAGLAIMLFGFLYTPLITAPSVILWSITLFILRTGACFTEIGTESYFFKQIDDTNSQMIEFWRLMHPLAFVLGPIIAGIAVLYLPLPSIFFIIAAFLVVGVVLAKNIKYDKKISNNSHLEDPEHIPMYDLSYDYGGYKLQSDKDLP